MVIFAYHIGVPTVGLMNVITCLFVILCLNIATQFKVLNKFIQNLDFKGKEVVKDVRFVVNLHNQLLDCCSKLNRIYQPIFMAMIFHFAVLSAIQGFLFVIVSLNFRFWSTFYAINFFQTKDNEIRAASISYFLALMLAIFVIHFSGEQIIEEVRQGDFSVEKA